jgi:hypothetical protein
MRRGTSLLTLARLAIELGSIAFAMVNGMAARRLTPLVEYWA